MTHIGTRVVKGVKEELIYTPIAATYGLLTGYIYGKLADIPSHSTAKAWAIWRIADNALQILSHVLTENRHGRAFLSTTFLFLTTAIGIQELRKKGLIGEKMILSLILFRVFQSISILSKSYSSN